MNSTKESPLQFFYDFFQKGIYTHRNKFLNQDPNLSLADIEIVEINKEAEYIKTRIFESGEWILSIGYYKDVLASTLSEQVKISIDIIKSQVKELSREGKSFYFYLDAVLGDLNEIREIVSKSRVSTKYGSCIGSVYKITSFLLKTYPSHFEKNESPVIIETKTCNIEKKSHKNIKEAPNVNKPPKGNILAFKWKDENPMNTILLYDCLKSAAIKVETDTLNKFNKAFSGEVLTEPLKIKWILTKSGKHVKPPLVRVFDLLINKLELIAPVAGNTQLASKLEYIFVDPNGKAIKNIKYVYKNNAKTEHLSPVETELLQSIENKFQTDKKS